MMPFWEFLMPFFFAMLLSANPEALSAVLMPFGHFDAFSRISHALLVVIDAPWAVLNAVLAMPDAWFWPCLMPLQVKPSMINQMAAPAPVQALAPVPAAAAAAAAAVTATEVNNPSLDPKSTLACCSMKPPPLSGPLTLPLLPPSWLLLSSPLLLPRRL